MSFRVIECEQRSPEWRRQRAGILTASHAAAMLSKPKKNGEETVGKSELRVRLALELMRGEPIEESGYENEWMRRGVEREADALRAYEAAQAEVVQAVGFLRHDTLPIGCSPDAVVGDFCAGVEVKAPRHHTHYEYLKRGTVPPEYVPQILHSLFVTDFPWWDFCSYCPEFEGAARLFVKRVYRNQKDLDDYALAFDFFWREVEFIKNELCALRAPELPHAV